MYELDTGTLDTDYFLGDALGSARQLTDAQGRITLAKAYNPYGEVTQSAGPGTMRRGWDASCPGIRGRGDYNRPGSLNRWGYVEGNPINLTDPTGLSATSDDYPPMFFDGMEVCFQLAHDATWLAVDQGLRTIPDFRGMRIVEKVMEPDPNDYILYRTSFFFACPMPVFYHEGHKVSRRKRI